MLWVFTGVFSAAAQGTTSTQPGVIASFAPVVEKVAPSVVTVFTTQTVSRTTAPFPFSGRRAATIFRRTTSATARQANAAGPRLGRDR